MVLTISYWSGTIFFFFFLLAYLWRPYFFDLSHNYLLRKSLQVPVQFVLNHWGQFLLTLQSLYYLSPIQLNIGIPRFSDLSCSTFYLLAVHSWKGVVYFDNFSFSHLYNFVLIFNYYANPLLLIYFAFNKHLINFK